MSSKRVYGGKTRRCRSMKGGVGAADNAIAVFGDMKDQQPVGGGDHTIAMKQISGGGCNAQKILGGNMITDLGVPAVLVAANHLYKKRGTKKGGKKRRGTKKGGKKHRK
jgi:hypothetical protein